MSTECSTHEPLLSSGKQEDDGFSYVKDKKAQFLVKLTRWFLKFAMCSIFIAWVSFLFLLPSESVTEWSDNYVDATSGSVKKKPKHAAFRLWTFPVIVDGPFGVVTAAELIGILLVVVYIIWAVSVYAIQNYNLIPYFESQGKRNAMLKHTGLRFGSIGLICIVFLFLPVARGSILLRLTNIPFEHATRYHVWLGHLTMTLFTLHGSCYFYSWILEDRVVHQLINWKNNSIANLPGVISLSAGLLMWVTSLPPVRRLNFEIFYYTHHLYIVFIVFMAMHVGDIIFSYNALSWVFLQVRELSWLQWHPFSVSSSPLDGKHHLAILIKVLGNWTQKLRGHILSITDQDGLVQPNLKLKASVEGPYGHESPYHLLYENLILVAGGIGISPFLAILSDILHRVRDRKPCMPRNVVIIWAVKRSQELPLLHSLDMESLCPTFNAKLNLEIQTYVTQESEPPLEEGEVQKYASSTVFSSPSQCGMSRLVGTGNTIWSGTYVMVSTIGLVVSLNLVNVFYINPYDISYQWYKGLLLLICMVASVIVFGGLVIGLWSFWDRISLAKENFWDEKKTDGMLHNESTTHKNLSEGSFAKTIKHGQRPDFTEIFGTMAERWGNVDIGVIVCGPTSLERSVAKECRSKNIGRKSNAPIFHFNRHSFDL
ncbi:cytochrome b245, heavy chain [Cynara cardunculus var. scolymus]|uniref:ferric-chelate reductase (NADH) n=1 Tax=Cynara cardunculus var. scolymus TaxID=59895 RepID=A0A103Y346_CYNCS|nr:cytochrome b245, heavy chain [Cynara cardunculus var. scolymus]